MIFMEDSVEVESRKEQEMVDENSAIKQSLKHHIEEMMHQNLNSWRKKREANKEPRACASICSR